MSRQAVWIVLAVLAALVVLVYAASYTLAPG